MHLSSLIGRTIIAAHIDDDALSLTFEGEDVLTISDDGQSCCEHRYITCDDSPSDLVGLPFVGVETKGGDYEGDDSGDCHETQFVEVKAGVYSITMTTHNIHNGYYGGFWICCKLNGERVA